MPMVLNEKRMTGEVPVIVARALSEIKEAVRELRDTIPESALVRLAEQKIEMMERGEGEDRGPRHGDKNGFGTNS